jgi:hypothetical protein
MTREQAKQLVYSDIDHLRIFASKTADAFHELTQGVASSIAVSSKKELLAYIICLLANNHSDKKGSDNAPF